MTCHCRFALLQIAAHFSSFEISPERLNINTASRMKGGIIIVTLLINNRTLRPIWIEKMNINLLRFKVRLINSLIPCSRAKRQSIIWVLCRRARMQRSPTWFVVSVCISIRAVALEVGVECDARSRAGLRRVELTGATIGRVGYGRWWGAVVGIMRTCSKWSRSD